MENRENKGVNKGHDNLIPCKPGETHNPNGRPLGQRNYATLYREALLKLAEINKKTPIELENEIVSNALLAARKGDYRFYKDILDRLYGTPVNHTELTGKNGGAIKVESIPDDEFKSILASYGTKPREENTST